MENIKVVYANEKENDLDGAGNDVSVDTADEQDPVAGDAGVVVLTADQYGALETALTFQNYALAAIIGLLAVLALVKGINH